MMQSLDNNIGRVLQALDVHGLAANTIVVFTSDNGGERFSNIWPFSGMKGELLEGGLRIPAIARWPGRIASGVVSEQVMISMDWMPTLLAAAGTQMDPAYPPDGDNLLPILSGRASPHPRKLFWRFKAGGQRAVRDGDWKYLQIAATNSCSTWSRTRASGPISKIVTRTFSIASRATGRPGTTRCWQSVRICRPTAIPRQCRRRSLWRRQPAARGPAGSAAQR